MSHVRIHLHNSVGTIIINRPEKRNALNRACIADLRQAFSDLHREKKIRSVVLTGAGTVFCAGMDLAEMRETSGRIEADSLWQEDAQDYRDLLEQMLRFPKPIIAAVNGPAVAGGAGLLLASDIVIAANNATICLPEPRRGLVAGIVSPLLHFRVGGGRAAFLLLTAESIDAAKAEQFGLFHEIVAADILWPHATTLGEKIAASAPEALLMTKRMLNETIGEHLFTLLTAGAAVSATARTTEAAAEGLKAFLEKRAPKWP